MLWEELSAQDFEASIDRTRGVCVLPIGVLEKHGSHLPLGTDMYIVRAIAEKAAEQTGTVVFPYYFLGQIAEARHVKGTLAPTHPLIMDTLLEMCDEIYRNGFTKIFILNGHGGNEYFLPFFTQQFPGLNRPYAVYTRFVHAISAEQLKTIQDRSGENNMGDHAGFLETSLIMHLRPELVHMEKQIVSESVSLERLKDLEDSGIVTGFDWYAKYPCHFAGDPSQATAEFGAFIFDILLDNTINAINAIKTDNVSMKIIEEYNRNR
ncbi:MAG: creatininase family protein [Treponema sp.]|nr:creatininase family protein [Treponema sp.]